MKPIFDAYLRLYRVFHIQIPAMSVDVNIILFILRYNHLYRIIIIYNVKCIKPLETGAYELSFHCVYQKSFTIRNIIHIRCFSEDYDHAII